MVRVPSYSVRLIAVEAPLALAKVARVETGLHENLIELKCNEL